MAKAKRTKSNINVTHNIQTRKENLLKKITFDYYSINVYVFRHMGEFYMASYGIQHYKRINQERKSIEYDKLFGC